jgi:phosphoribosylformylglycinamidine synthase
VGVGIVKDIRSCITMDFKQEQNRLYLIGKPTEQELGGSEYYQLIHQEGGRVPQTNTSLLSTCMNSILTSIQKGFVASCHDVSEGGIGVCVSEMAMGGDLGATLDLTQIDHHIRSDGKLFSESNTRWIVEVYHQKNTQFETTLRKNNIPYLLLGKTKGSSLTITDKKKTIVDVQVETLRDHWKTPLWDIMG